MQEYGEILARIDDILKYWKAFMKTVCDLKVILQPECQNK